MPPRILTADGRPRRVGVELELSGIPLERAVEEVAAHLAQAGPSPSVTVEGRYEQRIDGDPAGPWQVELDVSWLKELGRRERDPDDPLANLEEAGEQLARTASEWLMPIEVVSPPLPMERLAEVEDLIVRLRAAGALGTGSKLIYAFGLQLNPEVPDTDAETLCRYLQAFLCLFDWLHARARVDFARRLTVFIAPFPKHYVRTLVDPDYRPDLTRLIDDYLDANPTRNRALDCLPLFAALDPERVRATVPDPRVKPRPALHYRLPNCEIDRPDWGLRVPWEDWLQVERLAVDRERLDRMCRAYSGFLDRPLAGLLDDWTTESQRWITPIAHP